MPRRWIPTSFGTCSLSWENSVVTEFRLPANERPLDDVSAVAESRPDCTEPPPAWVENLMARVQWHLAGNLQDFSDVPLDWSRVSQFQQAVYRQTLEIKPGQIKSYGEIAYAMNLGPETARAVGAALGTNPWPLIVPCHRVVAASGRMTGFSAPGGIRTKTRLLVLEGAELLSE